MRRRSRTAAAVVTPVLLLMGCAGVGSSGGGGGGGGGAKSSGSFAGQPKGALNIMGFGGEDEVAQARIDAFTKTYPDVKVTHNKGDFDAQQFLTALASGNPPDLVYFDRKLIGTYAAKGAVQPLTDCIKDQKIDTSQYRPAAMKAVTLNGKVYGIPEFYIVTVNLIGAKVLADAGLKNSDIQTKDWAALESTAQKLFTSSGSKVTRIGYDTKMPDDFPLWARINGAELVKDDGSPNLNDPKAVEALDFNLKMVKDQGGWTNFKSFRDTFDIFGAKNPLTVGSLGAMPMENWYVNVLRDSIGNGLKLDSTPVLDRSGKQVSTLGGSTWAIPKGAKNPVAACAWAKTMTDKDAWMKAAAAREAKVTKDKSFFTGLFTANKPADEAIKAQYLKSVPDKGFQTAIENFYSALDIAQPTSPSPVGEQIDNIWRAAVSSALDGKSARAALDQAQKQAQSAYDKTKQNG